MLSGDGFRLVGTCVIACKTLAMAACLSVGQIEESIYDDAARSLHGKVVQIFGHIEVCRYFATAMIRSC